MNWNIKVKDISQGGFAPAYHKETYPMVGNNNQAAAMVSCDLTNPSYLTQGPGLASVSPTVNPVGVIKGILKTVVSANKTYGISATKMYEITPTTLIEKDPDDAITGGEDVALYGNKLLFSHDTDILIADNPFTNANENWWTTVAGGAALTSGEPHQMVVAGTTGLMTVLNGSVVASWDGTTAVDSAFDTQDVDITLVSQVWTRNNFYFAGNKPNATGRNEASIFIWNGTATSWNNRVEVNGKIGAMFVRNGVPFVLYQKNISDGTITLGYCDGNVLIDITNYEGSLPAYYQITEYKDHLIWASGTNLFAWGGNDLALNTKIFQLGVCGVGGLANPFGAPMTASSAKLQKFSGHTVTCSWKSLLFDVTQSERRSMIDKLRFNFEKLVTGARVDFTLKNNQGTSLETGTISFAGDGADTSKTFNMKKLTENFRIELNWANGSATNAVAIKDILIIGHTL